MLLGASAAGAEPTLPEKRRQAELILAQVQALDAEVGAAAERYNGANYKLSGLSDRLRETRASLKRARAQLGTAQAQAGERLVHLYTSGSGPSAVEVLLGAGSLSEMFDQLEVSQRVLAQDIRISRDLKQLTARTKRQARQIAAARSTQAQLVRQLDSERAAIAAKLSDRQQLLGSVRAEVAELEAVERRRQVELRRQAEAELARQRALAAAQDARAAEARRAAAPAITPPPANPAADPSPAPVPPPEPAPAPAPPADAGRGAQVVAIAMRYLGVPYKWGGASPSTGFDCSGLTMYVFAQIGVSLPHYAAAQYGLGRPVSKSELQPGDLVFFSGLGHMGMYIGAGNFIHAPRTGDVVKISSLSDPYRVSGWVGARRVL
jgi:cell wall-associated NlpC family hydrolase